MNSSTSKTKVLQFSHILSLLTKLEILVFPVVVVDVLLMCTAEAILLTRSISFQDKGKISRKSHVSYYYSAVIIFSQQPQFFAIFKTE